MMKTANKEAGMLQAWVEDLYDDVKPPNRTDVDFFYRHLEAALVAERRQTVDNIRFRVSNATIGGTEWTEVYAPQLDWILDAERDGEAIR